MTIRFTFSHHSVSKLNGWSISIWSIALLIALPLLAIASGLLIDTRTVGLI
jgi:hypothetical protein